MNLRLWALEGPKEPSGPTRIQGKDGFCSIEVLHAPSLHTRELKEERCDI